MSSQPETSEPSRAARDELAAIVDDLDLRRRRAAGNYEDGTKVVYRTYLRAYLEWCQRQGLAPEINDRSARDYVNHLRETEQFRPGTMRALISGLRYYAAVMDPIPALVEAGNLVFLYRKALDKDGVPTQRRGPRRTKARKRTS